MQVCHRRAISPAYSLMSKDFDKLKSMITLLGARRDLCFGRRSRSRAALAAIAPLHTAAIVARQDARRHLTRLRSAAIAATAETD